MLKRNVILISIIVLMITFCGCDYFGPGMADFNYNLSGSYLLYHAGYTYIYKNEDKVIESNVNGIAWDNNFILATQEENNKTNYWIIDVNANKIYGPFNEKDFNTKKSELKINSKLKLEDPAKYKSLEKKAD